MLSRNPPKKNTHNRPWERPRKRSLVGCRARVPGQAAKLEPGPRPRDSGPLADPCARDTSKWGSPVRDRGLPRQAQVSLHAGPGPARPSPEATRRPRSSGKKAEAGSGPSATFRRCVSRWPHGARPGIASAPRGPVCGRGQPGGAGRDQTCGEGRVQPCRGRGHVSL